MPDELDLRPHGASSVGPGLRLSVGDLSQQICFSHLDAKKQEIPGPGWDRGMISDVETGQQALRWASKQVLSPVGAHESSFQPLGSFAF